MGTAEKRQARLAYLKEYRAANAARIAEQKKAWYEANKLHCNAKSQERYAQNKEAHAAQARTWMQQNPGKAAEYARRFKLRHPDKVAAERKAYKQDNKGLVNANTRKRQADKLLRTPKWLTEDDMWLMQQAYELAQVRTAMFGFPWHVDHILPLRGRRVSGLHVPTNLQVIPGADNCRKSNHVELT